MTELSRILPIKPNELSLIEHLVELRGRLVKAALALVISVIGAFFIAGPLLAYLQQPYGREFTVLGPTGGIVAFFQVALMVGGIIASPMMTYQVLRFILPGLNRREKNILLGSLVPMTLLLIIGALFAWFILIPPALGFLEGFQPTLFRPEWTADLYLGFVTTLIFWMGVAFELPLVFFVVALLGFVKARQLLAQWRLAIVGAALAAAIITPTVDPVNMALVIMPLLALYILSIVLVALATRIRK